MNKFAIIFFMLSTLSVSARTTVSVARYLGDRQCAVSLTFDDGMQEHYTLVAPHLDRYGLKGTFGINGKYIGDIDDRYSPRMTWSECRSLAAGGHEICSHTWSHPNLYYADEELVIEEIEKNDSAIIKEIGVKPMSFLYPFNAYTPFVKEACEKGRTGSRTYQFALGQRNSGCTLESAREWLRNVIDKREWGVAMTHGIYTGWDQWDEPWELWQFFCELAMQQDSVWIDTFSRVQAYVKERDAVKLNISEVDGNVVVKPSIDLDSTVFKMPLTLRLSGFDNDRCLRAVQGGHALQVVRKGDCCMVDINPFGPEVTIGYADKDILRGKSVCFIGDSYVANHGCPVSETWHYRVAEENGMKYYNLGRNGNSAVFERDSIYGLPILQRYSTIPADADLIVIIAGHNDAYIVGENLEKQAELRQGIDKLLKCLKRNYPKSKIGWVTPWNVEYNGFQAVLNIVNEVCRQNGVVVLDAALTSGINPNDSAFRSRYFQSSADNAHLNAAGHELILDWGRQFLVNLCYE